MFKDFTKKRKERQQQKLLGENGMKPATTEELRRVVKNWKKLAKVGIVLNDIDTSLITDMSRMFWCSTEFNQPLNNWNTENVINMSNMFYKARNFNQPLNNWNTENVTDMSSMFLIADHLTNLWTIGILET